MRHVQYSASYTAQHLLAPRLQQSVAEECCRIQAFYVINIDMLRLRFSRLLSAAIYDSIGMEIFMHG